jgi:hypothetical protein
MRAILEINLPESCFECPLFSGGNELYPFETCRATKSILSDYRHSRDPSCPLKILPDEGFQADDGKPDPRQWHSKG